MPSLEKNSKAASALPIAKNNKENAMPYFPGVEKVRFEGPSSDAPLAFRHYDANGLAIMKITKGGCDFEWQGLGCCDRPRTTTMKTLPPVHRIALLFNGSKIYDRGIITGIGNYLSSTRVSWDLFLEEDFLCQNRTMAW